MTKETLDWTHKHIRITDIRKLNKLYVIKINDPTTLEFGRNVDPDELEASIKKTPSSALYVKDVIFEERLKSYFFNEDVSKLSREKILDLTWNMYITKGYFIKINENGIKQRFIHNPEKWYVSYLEIDGDLGTFDSVFRDRETPKDNSYTKEPFYTGPRP